MYTCTCTLSKFNSVHSTSPVRPAHRPKQNIEKNQLMFLIQCGFINKDISHLMKCSTKTIQRRIVEFGLSALKKYSVITDCELDRLTTAYVDKFPASDGNSYHAFLDSQGIKLQHQRVRDSMLRVDEDGVRCRFGQAIKRRSYHVEMPNSLWHIDGYHKLIRWHIVIHGGLDGYSRIPVFLCASNNNQASTVLHCFLEGVQKYGLPSRVRCDKGRENVLVCQFMLSHPDRGPGRRSCITGRSVHNQRIERFWRDLYTGCICYFYQLFNQLEDCHVLDVCDPVDLFSLYYVFLPVINQHLQVFCNQWSFHRLRTCGHQSPLQLFIRGHTSAANVPPTQSLDLAAIQSIGKDVSSCSHLHEELTEFCSNVEEGVHIPLNSIAFKLDELNVAEVMNGYFKPNAYTTDEVVDLYIAVCVFITEVLKDQDLSE